MQNNADAISWKRGKDKNRKLKKISLANHPSFFCFLIFLFQRWLKGSVIALYDHIENVVETKFQNYHK